MRSFIITITVLFLALSALSCDGSETAKKTTPVATTASKSDLTAGEVCTIARDKCRPCQSSCSASDKGGGSWAILCGGTARLSLRESTKIVVGENDTGIRCLKPNATPIHWPGSTPWGN